MHSPSPADQAPSQPVCSAPFSSQAVSSPSKTPESQDHSLPACELAPSVSRPPEENVVSKLLVSPGRSKHFSTASRPASRSAHSLHMPTRQDSKTAQSIPVFRPRAFRTREDQLAYLQERFLEPGRSGSQEETLQELRGLLQRKTAEAETLAVRRDELLLVALNEPEACPVEMDLALLQAKAKAELRCRDAVKTAQAEMGQLQADVECSKAFLELAGRGRRDMGSRHVVNAAQSEEALVRNLQLEVGHLVAELNQEDARQAKQLRQMEAEIVRFREDIFRREEHLKQLKAEICTLHIRARTPPEPSIHPPPDELFVGNEQLRPYSRYFRDAHLAGLCKLSVEYFEKADTFALKCFYEGQAAVDLAEGAPRHRLPGKQHSPKSLRALNRLRRQKRPGEQSRDGFARHLDPTKAGVSRNKSLSTSRLVWSPTREAMERKAFEGKFSVGVSTIISLKAVMAGRVIGLELQLRGQFGPSTIRIGKTHPSYVLVLTQQGQGKLVAVGNRRITSLGTYWHRNQLVGFGLVLEDIPACQASCRNRLASLSSDRGKHSRLEALGQTPRLEGSRSKSVHRAETPRTALRLYKQLCEQEGSTDESGSGRFRNTPRKKAMSKCGIKEYC